MADKLEKPRYTSVTEWVSESGAVAIELGLYQHLAKRLNHTRNDRLVEPSRARLAEEMGFQQAKEVDPYLRALVALRVVEPVIRPGKATQYRLPLWPPAGWQGPRDMAEADRWKAKEPDRWRAWRAQQRAAVEAAQAPAKQKARSRSARHAAKKAEAHPDLSVTTDGLPTPDLSVATDTHLSVTTDRYPSVTTDTNQTKEPNEGTTPLTAVGQPPVVGGRSGGGCAASDDSQPAPKTAARDLRSVVVAIPALLASLLERDFPRGLPAEVNDWISRGLLEEQRTPEQLADRMARRWVAFGYEADALEAGGRGIDKPKGVLEQLLSPSKCWGNNLDCEDGTNRWTDEECPRCAEARAEKAAERAQDAPSKPPGPTPSSGYSVPFQRDDTAPVGPPQSECRSCRAPIALAGHAAEDRLCAECRAEGPPESEAAGTVTGMEAFRLARLAKQAGTGETYRRLNRL
jgi:hypothetical protein